MRYEYPQVVTRPSFWNEALVLAKYSRFGSGTRSQVASSLSLYKTINLKFAKGMFVAQREHSTHSISSNSRGSSPSKHIRILENKNSWEMLKGNFIIITISTFGTEKGSKALMII